MSFYSFSIGRSTMENPKCTENLFGSLRGRIKESSSGKKIAVIFLFFCTFMQSFFINGLVVSVETTLEKRFNIKSTYAASMVSAFHFVQGIVQLPLSHYSSHGNAPQWIGSGMFGMGVFCTLLSVPHFAASTYKPATDESNKLICREQNATAPEFDGPDEQYWLIYLVLIQVSIGIANTPLFSLGLIYIRRNTDKRETPLYIGIFFAGAVVGGACGSLVGGWTLTSYTNISERPGFTESSPLWVGAWWVGFLAGGLLTCVVALPVFLLPKSIHHDQIAQNESLNSYGFGATLKKAIKMLKARKIFTLLAIALAFDYGTLAGVSTFAPKYVQTSFGFTASEANFFIGAATIVGSLVGFVGGGAFMKAARLEQMRQFLKYLSLLSFLTLCGTFSFMLRCANQKYAETQEPSQVERMKECINGCACNREHFQPVCGEDGFIYFSPCFAGCKETLSEKTYNNCKCLLKQTSEDFGHGWVNVGNCSPSHSCHQAAVFIVIFGFVVLLHTATLSGGIRACMKAAEDLGDLDLGVGVMWTLIRLLGMFPFPLIYGGVLQSFCLLWSNSHGEPAVCRFYDVNKISLGMTVFVTCQKLANLILFSFSCYAISRTKARQTYQRNSR